MDINEFIERYVNASDEIRQAIERIVTEAQQQTELQD